MKNIFISVFLLLSAYSFAQNATFQSTSQLNSWNLGLSLGQVQFYGDIKEYDWYPAKVGSFNELRFGAEASASKMLNNLYGFNISLNRGGFAGIRRKGGECVGCNTGHNPLVDTLSVKFEGDYLLGDVSLVYNLSNLKIKTNNPFGKKWLVLLEAGIGLISFRTLQTELNSNTLVASRGYNDFPAMSVDTIETKARQTESLSKLALIGKYRLNNKIDLTASAKYYHAFTDLLDATSVSGKDINGAKNDQFMYFSLGLSYKLGNKNQSVEWYSPLDKMYHSQKKTHKHIDGLTKDSDGDGVADQFDKNPETAEDIAVDGSGIPLDVDMDGVPDYLDVDPFTSKGASVDEFGKEFDSDGDGVPNSKDLELDTEEGAVVTYQGITLKGIGGVSSSFLPSVYFSSQSISLRNEDIKQLATVAKTLRNNPDINLIVIGHTDSHGDVYSNHILGLDRANTVIKHLIDVYGVDASRLTADSKGETSPLALTPAIQVEIEGRGITIDDYLSEINRRVDFVIAE